MNTQKKIEILFGLGVLYLIMAVVFYTLQFTGTIPPLQKTIIETQTLENESIYQGINVSIPLEKAKLFFSSHLVEPSGHVNLYYVLKPGENYPGENQTNSEAMSYYLLWAVEENNKVAFDNATAFIESYMLHPSIGYMMWRLEENDSVITDGGNIASDADLRTIKALLIAQNRWGDEAYSNLIDRLAHALEQTAITKDYMLAPYGGASGNATWTANEVWLSYTDFTVFDALAKRRGEPWNKVNQEMKEAILGAQISNGLYNSQITPNGEYGNDLDAGSYSINSLWILVRNAESNDPQLTESAKRGLAFYQDKYKTDKALFQSYDSSGNAFITNEAPWTYALVARAAINLGEIEFAEEMIEKLLAYQESTGPNAGGIIEGEGDNRRVGQFTMQESILTLQSYERVICQYTFTYTKYCFN